MANTIKSFYENTPSNANTVLYTVPAGVTHVISNVTFCNTTASPQTVTLSKGTKNMFNLTLDPNETASFPMNMVVAASQTISAFQQNNNAVNLFINGYEVS